MACYGFVWLTQGSLDDTVLISSMATIVLTFTGIAMLLKLCKPFTVLTGILFAAMTAITICLTLFAPEFFEIASVGLTNSLFLLILILVSGYLIRLFDAILGKINFQPNKPISSTPWLDQYK